MLEKINILQQIVNNIESDIYDQGGFDFNIICPYCDNEFIVDVYDEKSEVVCPKCSNTIELDWTGNTEEEYECIGSCDCNNCKSDCNDSKTKKENEDDM